MRVRRVGGGHGAGAVPSPALSSFADDFFAEEISAVLCKKAAFLRDCLFRYEGHLLFVFGVTLSFFSLVSVKLKLAPSLRLKEKLISLSDSVEQNAQHSLSKDLLSLRSLMELMELAIVCQLLFSSAERCFSAPASSAVTQQLSIGRGGLTMLL